MVSDATEDGSGLIEIPQRNGERLSFIFMPEHISDVWRQDLDKMVVDPDGLRSKCYTPNQLYNADIMTFLDKLPTVISCCFCCFLRAGTVLISIVSFIIGLFLAPNINHTPGLWQLTSMSDVKNLGLEKSIHMMLGIISIFLCIISVLLLIGALCNFPKLLEVYQWGAMVYCGVVCILFAILASYCAAVHGDCLAVGLTMLFLIIANILCTIYFVIVVNSLRVTSIFIAENKVMEL